MATFTMFSGLTVRQDQSTPISTPPNGSVQVATAQPAPAIQNWTLTSTVNASGIAAGVSQVMATAEIRGSNDNQNWAHVTSLNFLGLGPTMTQQYQTDANFLYYAAYLTASNKYGHASHTLTLQV